MEIAGLQLKTASVFILKTIKPTNFKKAMKTLIKHWEAITILGSLLFVAFSVLSIAEILIDKFANNF